MRIYDLFGGIGGFSEAARRVGWSTAGICEIDKQAVKVYNKNFHTNYTPTDVRKLNPKELPDFDILCAGFPCPSFSIAGKRQGFQDERGDLFFEIPRILRDKEPEMFLLENVEGILSSGSYLKTGIFKATKGAGKGELTDDFQRVKDESRRGWTEIRILITGGETFPMRMKKRQIGRRFKNAGEPAFTLTSQDQHGVSDGRRIRRLTPIECERLQNYPDNWTAGVSDSPRYRLLGNSVTVSVVEAIFRELQKFV